MPDTAKLAEAGRDFAQHSTITHRRAGYVCTLCLCDLTGVETRVWFLVPPVKLYVGQRDVVMGVVAAYLQSVSAKK